ncbi:MAG: peptidase M20, partial [Bacteroidales bacterium]|nr:peptidase M20 [Bacteroidales bacterium]
MKQYIQENRERFLDELFSLLRIPSVSAQAAHRGDMQRCAERLAALLLEAGADEARVFPARRGSGADAPEGHPVVFGSKVVDPSLKTVLVYGHYDVQPPEP